jgi:hypothetical protein
VRPLLSGLLLVVAVAGCGEDPIPLAEYRERVDAICRSAGDKTDAVIAELDRMEDDGDVPRAERARIERKLVEIGRAANDELDDVPPPAERADDSVKAALELDLPNCVA